MSGVVGIILGVSAMVLLKDIVLGVLFVYALHKGLIRKLLDWYSNGKYSESQESKN